MFTILHLFIIKIVMSDTQNGATNLENIHFFRAPKPRKTAI